MSIKKLIENEQNRLNKLVLYGNLIQRQANRYLKLYTSLIYMIDYDTVKPIVWGNVITGYRLYKTSGVFGSLMFVGYRWIIKPTMWDERYK